MYGSEHHNLEGYTNTDGAMQEHHHGILGYTFLFNGGAISWSSRKQELVTLPKWKVNMCYDSFPIYTLFSYLTVL